MFRLFEWNVICDICNKKIKSSEAKKRWDGFIVCEADFEHRNPLDTPIPNKRDQYPLPFVRGEATTDIETSVCSASSQSGVVGVGFVGCMIVGEGIFGDDSGVLVGTFSTSTL